jgi:hypothetical protein
MSDRVCPHEFYCWYRLERRCCHSSVVDIETCKGQEPSSIYVELTIRPHRSPGKEPPPEKPQLPPGALKRLVILAAG